MVLVHRKILKNQDKLVIATDLDGTFLGGAPGCQRSLYSWIQSHRERIVLIFVTGRGLGSVTELIEDPAVPTPDYVIGDVGASIAVAPALDGIAELEARMREGWPGDDVVRARFADIPGLEPQPVPMAGRVSFYRRSAEAEDAARALAAELDLEVLVSAGGVYLDILPRGANKGAALLALLDHLGESPERCLVCGDTLNDLSLYSTGIAGVVVGEAEDALVAATRGMDLVFHAPRAGCGGIADALAHFFEESVQ